VSDPYETLGVSPDASKEEIKRAYRRRAAKAHPDRKGGSAEAMKQLNTAYALLSDDAARERYDTGGEQPSAQQSLEVEASKMLSELFSSALDASDLPEQTDLIGALRARLNNERHNIQSQIGKLRAKMRSDEKQMKRLKYRKNRTSHDFLSHVLKQRTRGAVIGIERGERVLEIMALALEMLDDFSWEPLKSDEPARPALRMRHHTFVFTGGGS